MPTNKMQIKDNRRHIPIEVDGEVKATATWNPDDPRFARWCENMMGLYAGAAKLQKISFPEEWQAELETADDERGAEIMSAVQKPFADAADMIDQLGAAIDSICGEGIADVLFSFGNLESLQELIGMIWEDHAGKRKGATAKYRAKEVGAGA